MADKKRSSGRSQMAEPGSEKEQSKATRSQARQERKEVAKAESKPTPRRDPKKQSWFSKVRNSKPGRFLTEAYQELRYKVTWPTFIEARNMTIAVILLSAVVGAILVLADFGLDKLYLLIVSK
jgi:preprotein translocase SecE subunit